MTWDWAVDCANHPGVRYTACCTGCTLAYCGQCRVEVLGGTWCSNCKTVWLPRSSKLPVLPEARQAVRFAIIAVLCCGFVSPLAVAKGFEARKALKTDLRHRGLGHANTAILLGALGAVFLILGGLGVLSGGSL